MPHSLSIPKLVLIIGILFTLSNMYIGEQNINRYSVCENSGSVVNQTMWVHKISYVDQGVRLLLSDMSQTKFWAYEKIDVDFRVNDMILLSGRYMPIREFSRGLYLRRGICGSIQMTGIQLVSRPESILGEVSSLTGQLRREFSRYMSADTSGLLLGLFLGDNSLISADFENVIQGVGASHVFSVSASNFVLVCGIFRWLVGKALWRRRLTLAATAVFAAAYLLAIGTSNLPAFRAFIFYTLITAGYICGCRINNYLVLGLCLIIINLCDATAYADIGLQLSFGIWSGIMLINHPTVQKFFTSMQNGRYVFATLIIQLLIVMPLSLVYFQRYNLLSPVHNLYILPMAALLTIGAMFTIALYLLQPTSLAITSPIAEQLVGAFKHLLSQSAQLDLSVEIGSLPANLILISAGLMLVFILVKFFRTNNAQNFRLAYFA